MTSKKLPDNFSPIKHLNDVIRREQNQRVKEWFRDVEWQDNEEDIDTPRNSLRVACTIRADDSSIAIMTRLYLFYEVLGFGKRDLAVFHGIPNEGRPIITYHPLLTFVFIQDESATPSGEKPLRREKSVRLMKWASNSEGSQPAITMANLQEMAVEVRQQFMEGNRGIIYTCGNKSAAYADTHNGFVLGNYLLVNQKSDAIEIYRKICNVLDVGFEENKIIMKTPDRNSETSANADRTTILGKQIRKPRYRPIANMRFRQAFVSVGTVIPPVYLIDTTYSRKALL